MKETSSSWPVVSLGDICTLKYGKALPEGARAGGHLPVYGSNGVVGYHNAAITSGQTIIIGRKGSFGEVNYSESACWPIDTAYFIDEGATTADIRWLSYRLAALGLNRLNKAAAVPGLNREDAYRQQLLLPPVHEQRRIAAILDQADTLRAKRREALAQLDNLTQSIFIEMFGDVEKNSLCWPTKPLKELGRIVTGRTPPSSKKGMFGGKIPFVTPGDLDSHEPAKRTLTQAGANEVELVRAGSTLVCCIGTIGKMRQVNFVSAFNQQINAIEWGSEIDDDFGITLLGFFKKVLASKATLTTVPILNKSNFEKLEIPVPPRRLQNVFASRLTKIGSSKEFLRNSAVQLDDLFSSIQHRAFRGEL